MPSRVVRGEIVESDSLSRVSIEAELAFRNLIVAVDDFGRLDARPAKLKAALFPMRDAATPAKIVKWVRELASVEDPPVVLYEVNGRPYLYLTGWEKHRGKSRRANMSKYPDPAEGESTASPEIRGSDCRSEEKQSNPPESRESRVESRESRIESREDASASADPVDQIWPQLVQAAQSHGKAWAEKPGAKQREVLRARIRDGATDADLVAAVHGARKRFSNMDDPLAYLTATTIFAPTKFDANREAGPARGSPTAPGKVLPMNPRLASLFDEESAG